MSQAIRISELFAGNDWLVIYKAFTQVNLNAYDFDSIRSSMVDYMRLNYPEDYNDWIDSSEFVALLDLMAYLGQSLAFRMDLNARENFLDVARRRESVLRLARFLSYSPGRNNCASGLVKLVQVSTTNDIYDSLGNNLNGQVITWNDASNSNWYDQWIQVINDVLITTNPFGTPLQSATVGGIPTQLYQLNSIPTGAGNFPFTTYVDNTVYPFDIVNVNFNESAGFYEVDPDPQAMFNIIYRNDSNGNDSKYTGFFLMFKQGSLQKTDFNVANPLENRVLNITTENINQTDVWVQSINDAGYVVTNGFWTRVGFVPTDDISKILVSVDNITYNSVSPNVQNIFQVITQVNDQINIRFGDGRFGQIPIGNIRIWYRVSANQAFVIRPKEMESIQLQIPYNTPQLAQKRFSITFDLQETISNASQSETNDDIRRRAGAVYNTQGRMVSGSDYNTLPSTNTSALKVTAINRVYSGQSRYIDLNDPTGTYQNTKVFSDDGSIYKDTDNTYQEISLSANYSSQQLCLNNIVPQIASSALQNFIYDYWLNTPIISNSLSFSTINPVIQWVAATNTNYSNSGYLILSGIMVPAGPSSQNTLAQKIIPGAMIKFKNAGWVGIISVDSNNIVGLNSNGLGQVLLSSLVLTGDVPLIVLPNFRNALLASEYATLNTQFGAQRGFGMGYDYVNQVWYFIDITNIDTVNPYDNTTKGKSQDSSWLIRCAYSPLNWRIYTRNLQYVFESVQDVKFFFVTEYKTINQETGKAVQDTINIMKYNLPRGYNDVIFNLEKNYTYSDGFIEPARVYVGFSDTNDDGFPDNPESFNLIANNVGISVGSSYIPLVFHQAYIDINGYDAYQLYSISGSNILSYGGFTAASSITLALSQVGYELPTLGGSVTNGSFYVGMYADTNQTSISNTLITDPTSFTASLGSADLSFKWQHYAPSNHRIDPAVTNIIDIFVLTTAYYADMQSWYNTGCDPLNIPSPPTEDDLSIAFSELEQFKTFSDEIVWRPVSFKLILGAGATLELQASIKVVKLLGTTISDGETKSRIINAIQTFFDVNSWDFGETFYWSELSGYIHTQLVNAIASVALVPLASDQYFGDLFEIHCLPNELFFPTISVDDIEIIPANTQSSLRIN